MRKMIFIWIPKCAGTTISKHFNLERQVGNEGFNYSFNNNNNVTFGHADINILINKKILSKTFYQNCFKFCVVRNPYDRAVSLFHYQKLNDKFSFDDWINYLYNNRDTIPKNTDRNLVRKTINNQWNLMSSWIPHDIDKIYFFEDGISNIIKSIVSEIQGNEKPRNVITYNTSKHKDYREYYKTNPKTAEYVYEIYEKDFIRFNYNKKIDFTT